MGGFSGNSIAGIWTWRVGVERDGGRGIGTNVFGPGDDVERFGIGLEARSI